MKDVSNLLGTKIEPSPQSVGWCIASLAACLLLPADNSFAPTLSGDTIWGVWCFELTFAGWRPALSLPHSCKRWTLLLCCAAAAGAAAARWLLFLLPEVVVGRGDNFHAITWRYGISRGSIEPSLCSKMCCGYWCGTTFKTKHTHTHTHTLTRSLYPRRGLIYTVPQLTVCWKECVL